MRRPRRVAGLVAGTAAIVAFVAVGPGDIAMAARSRNGDTTPRSAPGASDINVVDHGSRRGADAQPRSGRNGKAGTKGHQGRNGTGFGIDLGNLSRRDARDLQQNLRQDLRSGR